MTSLASVARLGKCFIRAYPIVIKIYKGINLTLFQDFFLQVKYHKSSLGEGIQSFTKLSDLELKLYRNLHECQKTVHNALADSFDTPATMRALKSILSDSYSYLNVQKEPNVRLLIQVAVYVTKILSVFGVVTSGDRIGFGAGSFQSFYGALIVLF